MDRKSLLGKRIKQLRKLRRLSQEDLAEKAGISAQYVSNIERGKENPTLDLLFGLADSLKVSLALLCDFQAVQEMDRGKLRATVRELVMSAEPEQLKTALRVLRAVL
jgi:transcriptional regulator with XRE-family HTH domain